MQFTSFGFLACLAVLLVVYYLIPKKTQWILLLVASYAFYILAGMEYLLFILFTTATTYLAARWMGMHLAKQDAFLAENKASMTREERKEYKATVKKRNRVYMILCLAVNFVILFICKACLLAPVGKLLQGTGFSFLSLGLPMGISFFMFQSTGYVVDVYRGVAKCEKNFFRYALFVSFFPQLVQGPISKFTQVAPTMYQPHDFDGKQVSFGLQRMLWGYFKKLVIADRIVAGVIALQAPQYTGVGFLLLSVFYAIQIYGDFTGGIDITIGIAQALGITLPENFVRPYFSKNIAEYWRRWHISLGEWMKDYIFYPISVSQPMLKLSKAGRQKLGNFGKRLPVYIASIATWFCTGIWHGLTPNFILWGMMNCFVIVVSEELAPLYGKFHDKFHLKEKFWYGGFEMLRMFMLMNLIRVVDLFPAVDRYFAKMGSLLTTFNFHILWDGTLMQLGLTGLDYAVLGFAIILVFTVSLIQEKKGSVRELLAQRPAALRYGLIFALFLLVLILGNYGIGYNAGNFIYNQF